MTKTDRQQVAIVTGGARGLGLGIAKRLASDGHRIILWDIACDANDRVAGLEPLLVQRVDVSVAGSVRQAFDSALSAAGQIDVLVNNAGISGPIAPTWEYPPEQWQRVIDVDLTGVFHCCRTVIPHMRKKGSGRIVNIASIAGKEGNPNGSAYAAAKGGVIAYTKAIAKELAASGVLVNCIAPTMAETDLLRQMTPQFIAAIKAKIPMGRFVAIEEVAAMVAWIVGPDCTFTTGFTFDLSGGRATY
jgi:2-dehydro-3-deoxy-L-rhamnonate dehydrogenase (NAD+)